jgi:hypothetical protein
MLDRVGKAVTSMLVAVVLGYVAVGALGAAICGGLAVVIALVLWTPLRGWLGISAPAETEPTPHPQRVAVETDGGTLKWQGGRVRGHDTAIKMKDTEATLSDLDIG